MNTDKAIDRGDSTEGRPIHKLADKSGHVFVTRPDPSSPSMYTYAKENSSGKESKIYRSRLAKHPKLARVKDYTSLLLGLVSRKQSSVRPYPSFEARPCFEKKKKTSSHMAHTKHNIEYLLYCIKLSLL